VSERVAEIVALEGYANVDREARSAQRWAAARLIYEELQEKSFGALSIEIKAAGGKGSIGHLTCMRRCWDLVVIQGGIEPADYSELPFFGTVYNSDEVRRPADRKRRKATTGHTDRGHRHGQGKGPCLHESASAWITAADEALNTLAEHRVAWAFLKGSDLNRLKGLIPKVEGLVDLIEPDPEMEASRKGSATA
jgi:hypothetical protein